MAADTNPALRAAIVWSAGLERPTDGFLRRIAESLTVAEASQLSKEQPPKAERKQSKALHCILLHWFALLSFALLCVALPCLDAVARLRLEAVKLHNSFTVSMTL